MSLITKCYKDCQTNDKYQIFVHDLMNNAENTCLNQVIVMITIVILICIKFLFWGDCILNLVGSYSGWTKISNYYSYEEDEICFTTFVGAFGHALHIYSPSDTMDRLYVKSKIVFQLNFFSLIFLQAHWLKYVISSEIILLLSSGG